MNPYQLPSSNLVETRKSISHPAGLMIAGLALVQCVWCLSYFKIYAELVQFGANSLLTGLESFFGCILLYAAAIRFALNPRNGRYLFILSLLLNTLAVRGWEIRYSWSYPYAAAIAIAALATWLAFYRERFGHRSHTLDQIDSTGQQDDKAS